MHSDAIKSGPDRAPARAMSARRIRSAIARSPGVDPLPQMHSDLAQRRRERADGLREAIDRARIDLADRLDAAAERAPRA